MLKFINPLDWSWQAFDLAGSFVDLLDKSFHPIPNGAPMPVKHERPNALIVKDGVQLANAVQRNDVAITLTESAYLAKETLNFGQNVDLIGVGPSLVTIMAADNFNGSEMVSITRPGASLENICLRGGYRTVNGIQLEDAMDVLVQRCLLTSFQRNCMRMVGHTSNVVVFLCEMADTYSNHGIGMRETVSDVLIASSIFHDCGRKGDNDGFGLDLHGQRIWSLGNLVFDNHRGIKLPDTKDVMVWRCYVDDGFSHKYPPVSIWKSNESYGRTPTRVTITGCTLDSQTYHIGIWNSDEIFVGPNRALKSGQPVELLIKGRYTALPDKETPLPPLPPAPPEEPPIEPDTGDDIGGLDEKALDELTGMVAQRLNIDALADQVGRKLLQRWMSVL